MTCAFLAVAAFTIPKKYKTQGRGDSTNLTACSLPICMPAALVCVFHSFNYFILNSITGKKTFYFISPVPQKGFKALPLHVKAN